MPAQRRSSALTLLFSTLIPWAVAQQPTPSAHRWQLLEQNDPATGKVFREIMLSALDPDPAAPGPHPVTVLHLSCSSSSSTVIIASESPFRTFDPAHPTFPIRIDAEKPLYQLWANLSSHRILLYGLRDHLPGHSTLTLDLPFSSDSAPPAIFDLSQLAAAMRDFNCRRRLS